MLGLVGMALAVMECINNMHTNFLLYIRESETNIHNYSNITLGVKMTKLLNLIVN